MRTELHRQASFPSPSDGIGQVGLVVSGSSIVRCMRRCAELLGETSSMAVPAQRFALRTRRRASVDASIRPKHHQLTGRHRERWWANLLMDSIRTERKHVISSQKLEGWPAFQRQASATKRRGRPEFVERVVGMQWRGVQWLGCNGSGWACNGSGRGG